MPSFQLILAVVLLADCGLVSGRPQTRQEEDAETVQVDTGRQEEPQPSRTLVPNTNFYYPLGQLGLEVGELKVSSGNLPITRKKAKKGPKASALISGPEPAGFSVGGSEVGVGAEVGVNVGTSVGATLTFKQPAQVIAIAAPN